MTSRLAPARFESLERRALLSAGQLDPFFNGPNRSGFITTAFPDGPAELVDLEVRADGWMLGLGVYAAPTGSRLVLARFVGTGGDPNFGGGTMPAGIVDTGIEGTTGVIQLLKHGKILVASGSRLVRFNDDGTVDSSFVQDEPSRYKFSFNTLDIDVQPDGKILLSGRYKNTAAKPGHFAVARLKASGGRDASFGTGGVADFWQHSNSKGSSVRAMSDGTIYVAGDINHGYPNDLTEYKDQDALCVRLKTDGTLDDSYGVAGVAKRSGRYFAGSNMASTLAPDGTATIVAAGDDNALYRFTPDGILDNTFSGDGVAAGPYFASGQVVVAVQDDGAVLMSYVDYTTTQPPRIDKLVRWTAAGEQDMNFGTAGEASFQVGDSDTKFNVVTQGLDGSILVGGQADGKLMFARFWCDDAPAVDLKARNVKYPATTLEMSLYPRDDVQVDAASISGSDFVIITPSGGSITPFISQEGSSLQNGAFLVRTLLLSGPGGSWSADDNGEYEVRLVNNCIADAAGNLSPGRTIGKFWVRINA